MVLFYDLFRYAMEDSMKGKPFTIYIFVFLLLLLILSEAGPVFPDPDSFYHAKMAMILRDQGIIHTFPWFQFTDFKNVFVNPHFLYHVLLIPFVTFFDPLVGMKISAVVFGFLTFFVLFRILKAMHTPFPEWFTLAAIFSINFFHRMTLPRAPALAVALLLGLTWLLFSQKNRLFLFFGSVIFVWFYHGWPVLLLSVFAIFVAEVVASHLLFLGSFFQALHTAWQARKKDIFVVCGGLLLGLIFHPYFPQNIFFSVLDIFKIGIVNYQSILPVGQEWYPMTFVDLILWNTSVFVPLALCFSLFLPGLFLSKTTQNKKDISIVFTFLFLAGGYILLTLKSNRYVEYAIPFIILTSASMAPFSKHFFEQELSPLIQTWISKKSWRKKTVVIMLFLLVSIFAADTIHMTLQKETYYSEAQYKPATDWIRTHVPAGETVFHNSWDFSLILFYLDDTHNYIVGLDPTFMYDFDPKAFRTWQDIAAGKGNIKDILSVFHARTIVVDTRLDDAKTFMEQLDHSSLFTEVTKNEWIHVYHSTTSL